MEDPSDLSPYELLRLKRVEENRKVLKELGLLGNDEPPAIRKPVQKPVKPKNRPNLVINGGSTVKKEETNKPRRSIRNRKNIKLLSLEDVEFESDSVSNCDLSEDESSTFIPKQNKIFRPNTYGAIDGIPVGTTWSTRMDCSSDGVHRPTVAGIHGGKDGAYSIALSGGYEDDVDCGEGFTYTGSGGRDLKGTSAKPKNLRTASQSKDQTLDGVNACLAASVESKLPIRVIRGYKCPSIYAPEEGYRYDGLYTVQKYWVATGLSGFKVIKFALIRLKDQDPPPWAAEQLSAESSQEKESVNETSNSSDYADQPNLSNVEISEKKLKCNSPKKGLSDNEPSKVFSKSFELEQNLSPKGFMLKQTNENGINLKANEISKKSLKTDFEQNGSTRKSLANKLDNSLQEIDFGQDNEVHKTNYVGKNLSPRLSLTNKVDNFLSNNDTSHQEKGTGLIGNKSPKTTRMEQKISPIKSSVKKADSFLRESGSKHQANESQQQKKEHKINHFPENSSSVNGNTLQRNCKNSKENEEVPEKIVLSPDELQILSKTDTNEKIMNNKPEFFKEVPSNSEGCCEHCMMKVMPHMTENEDLNSVTDTSSFQCKPFIVLPGQTKISRYFSRLSADSSTMDKKVVQAKSEDDNTVSPTKKMSNNKEVITKSLRSNRRPSLYMNNNSNRFDLIDKDMIDNLSKKTGNNNVSPEIQLQSKKRENTSLLATNIKKQKKDPVSETPEKPKIKSPMKTVFGQKQKDSACHTQKKSNIKSPIKTVYDSNGKIIHDSSCYSSKLPIRNCYVKLLKLPVSDANFSGWNVDSDKFSGFTDFDIKKSKVFRDKFDNFLKSLDYETTKSTSPTSDNTWPGWDTVPSRSIVVTGFLINKYSNES